MAQLRNLTPSQVLLLAIQFATESDLGRLEILSAERKDVLDIATIYRLLLTFLPVDPESQSGLVVFLEHASHHFGGVSDLDSAVETSAVEGLSDIDINQRLKKLRLNKTGSEGTLGQEDGLAGFVTHWVHHAETTTGLSNGQLQLVDAFANSHPELDEWRNTYLLPLWRLQNDFYPGQADELNLRSFEGLQGEEGVVALLQFAERLGEGADIGRDLAEVVSPWVHGSHSRKRRRIHSDASASSQIDWNDVYAWIFKRAETRFELAAKAIMEWRGPPNTIDEVEVNRGPSGNHPMLRYAQTILAVIVISPTNDSIVHYRLETMLQKAIDITSHVDSLSITKISLQDASRANLMQNQLLQPSNPVTYPSEDAFQFLSTCIAAQDSLASIRLVLSIANIIEIALFGSEERQKQELGRILTSISQSNQVENRWAGLRAQIYSLHSEINVESYSSTRFTVLGRLPKEYIESQILDTILAEGRYQEVIDIYLDEGTDVQVDADTTKKHIIAAIYNAYDNASNGNRTRGGMKRASDLLKTFRPRYSNEEVFRDIDHLIKATHSLSFYQLTLQHGVPFKPVNIRVQHDPLSLVEKVLEQNSKAYTKLDDLLEIGRNLVGAGLSAEQTSDALVSTAQEKQSDATHRVTYLAIMSALRDDDFDTAYSYITTRLSTSPSQIPDTSFVDDTSWRAAYAAGRYRPSISAQSVHERIASLSKRMDLLSLALTLAPNPEPLSEILATWRRSEEEMDSLRAQALEEERSLGPSAISDNSSDVPGGFAPEERDLDAAETRRMHERRGNVGYGPTYEEEAPMGLFDVAKGAASAFRKSAFPLTAAARNKDSFTVKGNDLTGRGRSEPTYETNEDDDTPGQGPQKTRRKRDVVSGMVTGGLVSGMSWVLGAQPVNKDEEEARRRDHD